MNARPYGQTALSGNYQSIFDLKALTAATWNQIARLARTTRDGIRMLQWPGVLDLRQLVRKESRIPR
jgi:hypothetical protein